MERERQMPQGDTCQRRSSSPTTDKATASAPNSASWTHDPLSPSPAALPTAARLQHAAPSRSRSPAVAPTEEMSTCNAGASASGSGDHKPLPRGTKACRKARDSSPSDCMPATRCHSPHSSHTHTHMHTHTHTHTHNPRSLSSSPHPPRSAWHTNTHAHTHSLTHSTMRLSITSLPTSLPPFASGPCIQCASSGKIPVRYWTNISLSLIPSLALPLSAYVRVK